MQNINIGKSGIAVPFLGMGTWAIGGGAWWGDNDDALSVKAIQTAVEQGIFSIGDTLCTGKKKVQFAGIPTFSPEHFARIEQKDTMKRKQFVKGMEQIAQEGAIQIFREVGGGMEEVVVGVVGVLQLEVLEYRLNTEYNVEIRMQQLPFEQLRWVQNDPDTYNLRDLDLTSDTKAVEDMKGNRLLLFTSDWAVRWAETHNESLQLSEFGNI